MTHMKTLLSITAVLLGLGSANAQTNPSGGVTSGPAAGQPATLGTGGMTTATPHQSDSLQHSGGPAITAEQKGQHGGTRTSVKPGKADAGAGVHQTR